MFYKTLHFRDQKWLGFPGLTSGTQTNKLERLPKKTDDRKLNADSEINLLIAGNDQKQEIHEPCMYSSFIDNWMNLPS